MSASGSPVRGVFELDDDDDHHHLHNEHLNIGLEVDDQASFDGDVERSSRSGADVPWSPSHHGVAEDLLREPEPSPGSSRPLCASVLYVNEHVDPLDSTPPRTSKAGEPTSEYSSSLVTGDKEKENQLSFREGEYDRHDTADSRREPCLASRESHLESQEFHSSQSKDGEDAQAQREEKYSDCDDDNDDNDDDDDDDDDALSNALSSMHLHPENPTLERLDLEDADIDADRLVELLHACSLLPNLRILQLSSNALGDSGAEHVAHLLEVASRLEEVYFADNEMTDEGADWFAVALASCSSLRILDLSNNPRIGLGGALSLTDAIRRAPHVELRYENNAFQNVIATARQSSQNPKPRGVSFSDDTNSVDQQVLPSGTNADDSQSTGAESPLGPFHSYQTCIAPGAMGVSGIRRSGRARSYTIDQSKKSILGEVSFLHNGREFRGSIEDNGLTTCIRDRGRTYPSPIEWIKSISDAM